LLQKELLARAATTPSTEPQLKAAPTKTAQTSASQWGWVLESRHASLLAPGRLFPLMRACSFDCNSPPATRVY